VHALNLTVGLSLKEMLDVPTNTTDHQRPVAGRRTTPHSVCVVQHPQMQPELSASSLSARPNVITPGRTPSGLLRRLSSGLTSAPHR
jgi:hypothetical protein